MSVMDRVRLMPVNSPKEIDRVRNSGVGMTNAAQTYPKDIYEQIACMHHFQEVLQATTLSLCVATKNSRDVDDARNVSFRRRPRLVRWR